MIFATMNLYKLKKRFVYDKRKCEDIMLARIEMLPMDYAEYLHLSQLHPYTQHLECRNGEWYWIVSCLNGEAVQKIIKNVLWTLESIEIKKQKIHIDIVDKKYKEMTYRELMEQFYAKEYARYMTIHFISPTAFKQNGSYVFYPNLHCIFQSLMNKYDSANGEEGMFDNETLEQLSESAQIVRYDLKSVSFPLEGVRIPSFIGKVTIKIDGAHTMVNFAHMLFVVGEYSGVGIKTSLGMGCIKILEGRKKE